ncbi:MAG: hypothetical protein CMJ18_27710 [Phycisphaeraceae bacterium]|nr:hypothetical protein [Phycisphaeraceae bacterium]
MYQDSHTMSASGATTAHEAARWVGPATGESRSWIVSPDPDTIAAVRAAIAPDPRLGAAGACADLRELATQLTDTDPGIVVVDVDPDPARILDEMRVLADRFVQVRFVVLAARRSQDLICEAMQAGARHVQARKTMTSELVSVLDRLHPGAGRDGGACGSLYAVLSAAGGCGATTIAVNVADELAAHAGGPVLLVDLDTKFGAVAGYFGRDGEYGVADVIHRDGPIDPQLIRSTALRQSEGLDLLINPASAAFGAGIAFRHDRVGELAAACRAAYRCTVVDAPDLPVDAAADLAASSDATLLVMQPTVKDIRNARAMMSAPTDRGLRQDRVIVVANRYARRRHGVLLNEARRALGGIDPRKITNDYRAAMAGIDYGRPLAQAAPRCGLRRDVRDLAAHLHAMKGRGAASAV